MKSLYIACAATSGTGLRIVVDAHVLSDVGDFVDDVLDGHGSESIECESDFEHDQER